MRRAVFLRDPYPRRAGKKRKKPPAEHTNYCFIEAHPIERQIQVLKTSKFRFFFSRFFFALIVVLVVLGAYCVINISEIAQNFCFTSSTRPLSFSLASGFNIRERVRHAKRELSRALYARRGVSAVCVKILL